MKSIVEFILDEDLPRYNELVEMAAEAKAKAPKQSRAPKTTEQKVAAARKRMEAAQAKLDALLAMVGDDGE